MRYFIGAILATMLAIGVYLVLNGTGDDAPPSTDARLAKGYESLLAGGFVLEDTAPLDMAELGALLPEAVALSYDELTFDDDTGATRMTDVMIAYAPTPEAGLQIGELLIWGADLPAIAARMDGSDVASERPIVRRLEMRDVEVVGLEALYEPLMEPMNEMMTEAGAADGVDFDMTMAFDSYELKTGRVIIDDARFHPWEISDAPPGEMSAEDGEIFRYFQIGAAYVRGYSIEAITIEDMTGSIAMTQMGATTDANFTTAFVGYQGLYRGDLKSSVVEDMTYQGVSPWPDFTSMDTSDPDAVPTFTDLPMDGDIEFYTLSDLRMDKVLSYVAQGVIPPTTEEDLLSLGVWTSGPMRYALDGQPFYSMDGATADMSGFRWLMPTKVSFDLDGLTYNFAAFAGLFEEILVETEPEMAGTVDEVMAVLETHGLAAPVFNTTVDWTWDADDGPANWSLAYGVDGFGRADMGASGEIPPFAAWAGLIDTQNESVDEVALEEVFQEGAVFERAFMRLTDEGGIDKMFALAVEIAAVIPSDNPQVQAFAAYDPATVRNLAVAGIQMAGSGARAEFPPAKAWADAYADYVNEGGVFELRVEPETPLTIARIEAFDADNPNPDPDAVVEFLGITVEHTTP